MKRINTNFIEASMKLVFKLTVVIGMLWTSVLTANTYYFDGTDRIELVEDKGLLAEKSNSTGNQEAVRSSLVKRVDQGSELLKGDGGLLIWKTRADATKSGISKNYRVKNINSNYLPVYRNSSRTMMIPTGNIVVYFNQGFPDDQVSKWAASKGLRVLEKLPLQSKSAWVIETPPGLKSIEIANSIIGDGAVESATPNFWIEFAKK